MNRFLKGCCYFAGICSFQIAAAFGSKYFATQYKADGTETINYRESEKDLGSALLAAGIGLAALVAPSAVKFVNEESRKKY